MTIEASPEPELHRHPGRSREAHFPSRSADDGAGVWAGEWGTARRPYVAILDAPREMTPAAARATAARLTAAAAWLDAL